MEKIKNIFAVVLFVAGLICVLYALIMQWVLMYQQFGVIFEGAVTVIIPHKSLFGLLGLIPMGVGLLLFMVGAPSKKNKSERK